MARQVWDERKRRRVEVLADPPATSHDELCSLSHQNCDSVTGDPSQPEVRI
jgi:hypothetical protein